MYFYYLIWNMCQNSQNMGVWEVKEPFPPICVITIWIILRLHVPMTMIWFVCASVSCKDLFPGDWYFTLPIWKVPLHKVVCHTKFLYYRSLVLLIWNTLSLSITWYWLWLIFSEFFWYFSRQREKMYFLQIRYDKAIFLLWIDAK